MSANMGGHLEQFAVSGTTVGDFDPMTQHTHPNVGLGPDSASLSGATGEVVSGTGHSLPAEIEKKNAGVSHGGREGKGGKGYQTVPGEEDDRQRKIEVADDDEDDDEEE
ncbi:hypothetical protein YB2330_001630 [Saitoella coloradoensis]